MEHILTSAVDSRCAASSMAVTGHKAPHFSVHDAELQPINTCIREKIHTAC